MASTLNVNLFEGPRLKGRDRRTQNLSTKLTRDEEAELQKVCCMEGKTLSEWARDVLLRSARQRASRPEESILLTEIIGIQLLLMNILAPLTRGEHLSPEQYQNIIKRVQTNKAQTAQELIFRRQTMEQQ